MSQQPDTAVAKDTGGSFEPHPEGQYAVVCVDVVNLGVRVEQFQGGEPREAHKAALVFVSGERQDNRDLVIVTLEMTLSMHEKANMRQFLESWRGRSYTPEQAEAGVPLHKLQGQVALASIEHVVTRRGRRFAKIRSIAPLPKSMEPPDAKLLEEYTRPDFFDDRKKEYAAELARHRAQHENGNGYDGAEEDEGYDDDLPF